MAQEKMFLVFRLLFSTEVSGLLKLRSENNPICDLKEKHTCVSRGTPEADNNFSALKFTLGMQSSVCWERRL